MVRKIIKIDGEKCNGCGACASACHEGAIEIKDGRAELIRDDYCDGLGDCLPECPCGAISFEEREAAAYDAQAVAAARHKKLEAAACDGQNDAAGYYKQEKGTRVSQLAQWPCQIKLMPVSAPYFQDADLLIAADCTAFAYAGIHEDYMKGAITLTGCPKLDAVDYSEKLSEIMKQNSVRTVTVLRMEVPCCGGIVMAVQKALSNSGRQIPCRVVTVTVDGNILK